MNGSEGWYRAIVSLGVAAAVGLLAACGGGGGGSGGAAPADPPPAGSTNSVPVAIDDALTTDEDVAAAVTLAATDADGDTLTYAVGTPPAHGSLTGTAPALTYTPDADYFGADSFTFTANDGTDTSAAATVSITVTAVNDAPVAQAAAPSVVEDDSVPVTLAATDADGDTLSYVVDTAPTHGILTGTAPALTYTPDPDYFGADSFTFTASDGTDTSAAAAVSITVTAVNDVPVADPLAVTVDEDGSVELAFSGTDADGDTLTYAWSPPAHGLVTAPTGSLVFRPALVRAPSAPTYRPNPDYFGSDSFTYTASDGTATSAAATVTVTVTAVNDAPRAQSFEVVLAEDTADVPVTLDAPDPEGDSVSYEWNPPAHGTVTGTAPNLLYTPDADFWGTDTIEYSGADSAITGASGFVTLTVTPVNDSAPTIGGTPDTAADSGALYSWTPTTSDVDNDPLTFSGTALPAWATLNTATGELAGTPTDAGAGPTRDYTGIEICVTDTYTTPVCLTPFTITVTDKTPPGPVTGLTAVQDDESQVVLTWTMPTDADLDSVRVRRRDDGVYPTGPDDATGVVVFEGNSTTVVNTVPVGDYHYAAFASDENANFSDGTLANVSVVGPFERLEQRVQAGDPGAFDRFGWAVAIDGTYAVVGAPYESGGTGDPSVQTGAAYIFERDPDGAWLQTAKLARLDIDRYDNFGLSVDIAGDFAIVGAPADDGSTGNLYADRGAAYVFQRDGTRAWNQVAKLTASNAADGDAFGSAVTLTTSYAIVGAPNADLAGGLTDAGAAYIYKIGTPWTEVGILTASDAMDDAYFGAAVDVNSDTLVVGAPGRTAVGPQPAAGAGYVFVRTAGTDNWPQAALLTSSEAEQGDQLGWSVSSRTSTILLGAPTEDGGYLSPLPDAGAVNVYRSGGSPWANAVQDEIIRAPDATAGDRFGNAVAMPFTPYALVGAHDRQEGPYVYAGAAYLMHWDGATWSQEALLLQPDLNGSVHFGFSVDMSGDYSIIGAFSEDVTSPAPFDTAGAAYIFD